MRKLLSILLLIIIYIFIVSIFSYNCSNKKIIHDNNKNLINKEVVNNISDTYLGYINIPKIGVQRYLYPLESENNTVDKNIEVLKDSDMPDLDGGNFILAAHNGESPIAFFHDLDKLEIGDEVIVSYGSIDYRYVISDKYDVKKTGKVVIKRDRNKKTITLITCKGEDKQLVVIGYIK